MRLRFWRKKPKSLNLGTHRIKVKGNPSSEQLAGAMADLQNMSINNLSRMVSDLHSDVIGLRMQVRDLNVSNEKLKARIEKLELKLKAK